MQNQNNSYLSKTINISNDRYVNSTNKLGDRTITSNVVNGKRYFSSIDAEIYFGGSSSTFIDELIQITWSVEQSALPLFGYNSYTFDDLAVGARQVMGSFIINFTKSGYLYEVLKNAESVNRSSFYTNKPDNSNLSWSSNFHKEHSASWDKSFNIIIGYGDYNKNTEKTSLILLQCVQITSCQQVLSIDGIPIAESYSFIGKDVRYGVDDIPEVDATKPEEDTTTDEDEDDEDFMFNINSMYINRKCTYVKDEMKEVIEYEFNIDDYECSDGGEPKKTQIKFMNFEGNALKNSAVELSFKQSTSFVIPQEYATLIERDLTKQKNNGFLNENMFIYCDLTIYYSQNSSNLIPYYINKQKVSINFINN